MILSIRLVSSFNNDFSDEGFPLDLMLNTSSSSTRFFSGILVRQERLLKKKSENGGKNETGEKFGKSPKMEKRETGEEFGSMISTFVDYTKNESA